jgi:predicted nuclease with TOPRIM domain
MTEEKFEKIQTIRNEMKALEGEKDCLEHNLKHSIITYLKLEMRFEDKTNRIEYLHEDYLPIPIDEFMRIYVKNMEKDIVKLEKEFENL